MFGTKIRSWMEAHMPRSRKKDRNKTATPSTYEGTFRFFDAKFFGARDDFNEILPTLPLTSSSFKPQTPVSREEPVRRRQQPPQPQRYQEQHPDKQPRNSAVTLSSPESAYSTGYSTDGTSPCATYAPEYYNVVRTVRNGGQVQQYKPNAPVLVDTTTQTRVAGRRDPDNGLGTRVETNTGTYAVSRSRYTPDYQQQQQQLPWRKPTPPTPSRPLGGSPKIQVGSGHLMRKPYSNPAVAASSDASYPLQLFSPRRMPLVATTSTQVTPAKSSPRHRPRVRTNPWPPQQQQQHTPQQMIPWQPAYSEYCRQESLSVGRSPRVNRSAEWHRGAGGQYQRQRLRSKTRSGSSASSCSSRSRSCSISSSATSSPSSPSSDDVTLNEVIGKFDENYLYEKETDIVSDNSGVDNSSFSVNFSSDASASSLELLQLDAGGRSRASSGSRSSSRQRPVSGRRQRRRRHRRSVGSSSRDEEEHREEVELLQEVLNRRLKKQNSQASAQTNRALLERLLMKNTGTGYEGARRAWSANPHQRPAASRSLGGTPICLRRKTAPRNLPSRLVFERNHQVYPAESTSSLKNMSASELALIEADKEADLKYAQLIMEAERMLLNAQEQLQREESTNNSRRGSVSSAAPESSPSRFPRRPYQQPQGNCTSAPNKRVELLKNAELNIELALSKSRNSQPELSSGSIKDLLDHSSPKRLLQQQQKKMIEPMINQVAAASTQTPGSYLRDFQSIDPKPVIQTSDLNPTSENYSCPQSEPVKRKVYEGQEGAAGGRLLQCQPPPWLRNSDSDCTQDQPASQLQTASAASSYSQLRKHMLIETLQGLKQSLEDQSAALSKLNYLRPV